MPILRRIAIVSLFGLCLCSHVFAEPNRTLRGKITGVTAHDLYLNLGKRAGVQRGDAITFHVKRYDVSLVIDEVGWNSSRVSMQEGHIVPEVGTEVLVSPTGKPMKRAASTKIVSTTPVVKSMEIDTLWQFVSVKRTSLVSYRKTSATKTQSQNKTWVSGMLSAAYLGLLNLNGSTQEHYHQLLLQSSLRVSNLVGTWLSYQHRLRLRFDLGKGVENRPFQSSRVIPQVDRLFAEIHFNYVDGALGRVLAAPLPAATVTDGGTVRVSVLPGLALGAFGGAQPRIDDLRPHFKGTQFGGFVMWDFAAQNLLPQRWIASGTVGFLGTTWDGQIDRRALTAQLNLEMGRFDFYGATVIDFWEKTHPSDLANDLNTLLLDAALDATSWLRCGVAYQRYRFTPSRDVLELFPGFIGHSDVTTSLRATLDVYLPRRLDIHGGVGGIHQDAAELNLVADLAVRKTTMIVEGDWIQLSGFINRGAQFKSYSGQLSYFWSMSPMFSVNTSYALYYDTDVLDESLMRHLVTLGAESLLGNHWLMTANASAQLSEQERMLLLMGTSSFSF